MIQATLQIGTPWHREFFKNLGCLHGSITQHKHWELEHTYYSDVLVDVDIRFNSRMDHGGVSITVGLLGYGISFRIYDHRHWDYENNCWEDHEQHP
jgi:hypothetical protein